jgi:hypothetical protein
VFSFWDRLFGTFLEAQPKALGLAQTPAQGHGLLELLKFGFVQVLPPSSSALRAMIAEAAYFKAEQRGFSPGDDNQDWLEAEREIKSLFGFPVGKQK